MRLTRTGGGVVGACLVLLVAGLALGLPAVVALGAAGLAAVILAMTAVVESPAVEVSRQAVPTEVDRDAPAQITLEFRAARHRRARPFTVIETVDGQRRSVAMPAVPPGHAVPLTYDVDTSRRGNVVTGPLLLRRMDPFGLIVADRRVGGTCAVAVHPRRHRLRMLPTGRLRDLEGPTREVSQGSASFHQLREYVPGDDLRHIHWPTTARTGTLVVKQLVDTTRPEIVVIVDNRRASVGDDDFEEVVEIGASILHAADQDGFPSQLLFADGDNHDTDAGAPVPHLDRLTAVRLSDADSLFELAEALKARGRSLVFVTGELRPVDLTLVARITRGFSPAYLVSVVGERTSPFVAPPGVIPVACASAAAFVQHWKALG